MEILAYQLSIVVFFFFLGVFIVATVEFFKTNKKLKEEIEFLKKEKDCLEIELHEVRHHYNTAISVFDDALCKILTKLDKFERGK